MNNKKNNITRHNEAIAKLYGISNVETFRRAARRYEVRLQRLNELICSSHSYALAEREAYETEMAARRNLAKYCNRPRAFLRDLFVNSDPRGYALKLKGSAYRAGMIGDWGGFIVVAPENI